MLTLVAVGKWTGQGKRSGSVVDGCNPSWWAIAVLLAEAAGHIAASKPSYSQKHSIIASATGFQTPVHLASPTASAPPRELPELL